MMAGVSRQRGWGPTHQPSGWRTGRRIASVLVFIGLWELTGALGVSSPAEWALFSFGFVCLLGVGRWLVTASRGGLQARADRWAAQKMSQVEDPLDKVQAKAHQGGGGVYLGLGPVGVWCQGRPERAALVLGPPRSGKTSAVIIPSILAHTGPVVSTSTKPDVARATRPARGRNGRVWVFDPTGSDPAQDGKALRWSPVRSARDWEGALLMARAMTAGVGTDTTSASHWARRAQALLAPMLHAAAHTGQPMETVVDWVMRHELDTPGMLLEDERMSRLAFGSLIGLLHTEPRELASIFSAAADAIDVYSSETALQAAADPNFDPDAFVRSQDSVFIHAPAERQQAAAPIVCGLLAEIRRATYSAHATGGLRAGRVLFALDEAANIAPLDELPHIASEGGSQGIDLLVCLQDLSQARVRWGAAADGFLTLFGDKLLLGGIADTKTLEAVSVALGEYDRRVVSHTRGSMFATHPQRTQTVSTQRTRVLSPGEIAHLPAGQALHLDGLRWGLIELTPAHRTEPWRTLIALPAP